MAFSCKPPRFIKLTGTKALEQAGKVAILGIKGLASTGLGRLRLVGFLEGVSYLFLLGLAVPAKHILGFPLLVRVSGPIHGLLFILFVVAVYLMAYERNWDRRLTFKLMISSLIPFGNFYVDRKILRHMED